MTVHIAGYAAKKLKKRMGKCCSNLLTEEFISHKNPGFHYTKILSRGGFTIQSIKLANYVCTTFAILDFTVTVILKVGLDDRIAAEHVLFHIVNSRESFTWKEHKGKDKNLPIVLL